MKYRIDVNFDETGFLAASKAATDSIAAISPYVQEVEPADRIKGQNMGEKSGWTYVKKAYQALSNEPKLVHPKLVDLETFGRGINTVTKLLAIKNILKGWIGDMEGTFMLYGLDLMEQANYVRSAVKVLAEASSDYKELYSDLNFLYENRAEKAATTIENQKRIDELTKQVEALQKKSSFKSKMAAFS